MRLRRPTTIPALFVAIALATLVPGEALAHCDSLDGPVVQDARRALERGDPAAVLKWVKAEDEAEIRAAFRQTLAVRAQGSEAKALADRFFFETLVRIHRAGEGEGFTGLKPGRDVDPGIAAADQALESGSANALARELSAAVTKGVQERFAVVMEKKKRASDSVAAGREYVAAYVDYIHFVESAHRLAAHGASPQHAEPAAHAK